MQYERNDRALVIAPSIDPGLSIDEASVIANSLPSKTLVGDISAADIINEIQRKPWEIIWFVTHGTEDGIVVSDGLLGVAELVPIIRNANTKLVVFNTCSSVGVATGLQNELDTSIICTIAEIGDSTAINTARHLANRLNRDATYREAFNNSKPGGNSIYLFLEGNRGGARQTIVSNTGEDNEIARLSDEVERLKVLVDGDKRWGAQGLVPQMLLLMEELRQVKTRQTLDGIVQWLIFLILMILLTSVGFLIYQAM